MRTLALPSGLLGLFLVACTAGPGRGRPIRWQLIEKPYSELEGKGAVGDGQVAPEATALIFRPIYREDLATEVVVSAFPDAIKLLSLSPPRAAVGEEVTAVGRGREGDKNALYRVTARGLDDSVRIRSPNPIHLRGRATGTILFTRLRPGKGGLGILAERIE